MVLLEPSFLRQRLAQLVKSLCHVRERCLRAHVHAPPRNGLSAYLRWNLVGGLPRADATGER